MRPCWALLVDEMPVSWGVVAASGTFSSQAKSKLWLAAS